LPKNDSTNRRTANRARSQETGRGLRDRLGNISAGYFQNQTKDFNFLISLVVLIVAFGLVMVLSASNVDSIINTGNPFGAFTSQLLWAVLGLAMMVNRPVSGSDSRPWHFIWWKHQLDWFWPIYYSAFGIYEAWVNYFYRYLSK